MKVLLYLNSSVFRGLVGTCFSDRSVRLFIDRSISQLVRRSVGLSQSNCWWIGGSVSGIHVFDWHELSYVKLV